MTPHKPLGWSSRPIHRPSVLEPVLGLLAACTAIIAVLYWVALWLMAVPSATTSPDWSLEAETLDGIGSEVYLVSDLMKETPAALPASQNASMTVQRAIAVACRGMGGWCVPTMTAVALKETGMDNSAVGDGGRSRSAFQVRTDFPGRPTPSQLRDPLFAARWTLTRLTSYGFDTAKPPAPLVLQRWNGLARCGWRSGRCIGNTWAEYGLTVAAKAKSLHK